MMLDTFTKEEQELILNFKENQHIIKYRKLNKISLRELRRRVKQAKNNIKVDL